MKRLSLLLVAVLMLALFAVIPVFAAEGHIYGVVFYDSDGDGVWDDEAGIADVAVKFVPASGDDVEGAITLYSAWNDNDDVVGPDMVCTHLQDEEFGDSETHWKLPKGCNGTFGLPSVDGYWEVSLEVPEGYQLTTPGSYLVEPWETGEAGWLEFGLEKSGAGGQPAAYTGRQVLLDTEAGKERYITEGESVTVDPGFVIAGPFTVAMPK